jgi:malate synthase
VLREDVAPAAADLLAVPAGSITERGLRNNVEVSIRYLAAWLGGNGCVPIHHLMEDAATAEIARAQVWQWVHHERGVLDDGRKVTAALFRAVLAEELAAITRDDALPSEDRARVQRAARLLEQLVVAPTFEEFLTLPAYEALTE